MIHSGNMVRFLIIQNSIYLIISLIFLSLDSNGHSLNECQVKASPQYIFWNFVIYNELIAILITGLIGWQLRNDHGDAFSIKIEVTFCFYTAGLSFIAYLILFYTSLPRSLISIPAVITLHVALITSTVWPYYLSRKEMQNLNSKSKSSLMPLLLEILDTPEGFEAFLRYLETEFSSENLLFWKQVERIKNLNDQNNDWKESVLAVYHQFLRENAPCAVNLPFYIRTKVDEAMELFHEENEAELSFSELVLPLEEAQKNIYDLMNQDSFPRFQQTPIFIELHSNLISNGSKEGDTPHRESSLVKALGGLPLEEVYVS